MVGWFWVEQIGGDFKSGEIERNKNGQTRQDGPNPKRLIDN